MSCLWNDSQFCCASPTDGWWVSSSYDECDPDTTGLNAKIWKIGRSSNSIKLRILQNGQLVGFSPASRPFFKIPRSPIVFDHFSPPPSRLYFQCRHSGYKFAKADARTVKLDRVAMMSSTSAVVKSAGASWFLWFLLLKSPVFTAENHQIPGLPNRFQASEDCLAQNPLENLLDHPQTDHNSRQSRAKQLPHSPEIRVPWVSDSSVDRSLVRFFWTKIQVCKVIKKKGRNAAIDLEKWAGLPKKIVDISSHKQGTAQNGSAEKGACNGLHWCLLQQHSYEKWSIYKHSEHSWTMFHNGIINIGPFYSWCLVHLLLLIIHSHLPGFRIKKPPISAISGYHRFRSVQLMGSNPTTSTSQSHMVPIK